MKRYFPFTKKVALNCFNNFMNLEVIVLLAKDDVYQVPDVSVLSSVCPENSIFLLSDTDKLSLITKYIKIACKNCDLNDQVRIFVLQCLIKLFQVLFIKSDRFDHTD